MKFSFKKVYWRIDTVKEVEFFHKVWLVNVNVIVQMTDPH
jgi:hypothetical protein